MCTTKPTPGGEQWVTAQAVLSAAGASDVDAVVRALGAAGFEVSPPFAGSFAITADRARFESFFGAALEPLPDGGIQVAGAVGAAAHELPLDALPAALRGRLQRVLFTRPPDFGPTSY